MNRLVDELRAVAPWAGPLRTVFVGGGTPSLLRPDLWTRLLGEVARLFDLDEIRMGRGEFTVECNPETVTPELVAILAEGGVDRVSMGAQSFDPRHLQTLERWHQPESVARALDLARAAGIRRQSIDLIFGIPGQTLDDWSRDLDAALALGTEHVSCYNLTYEPGTAMAKRRDLGQVTPLDEEIEIEMFALTRNRLGAAGLHRYEISNFARPGRESQHNLAYWRQEQWLAAGPAAAAHVAGHRWKNTPRLDDYLETSERGFAPIVDLEGPDARRALAEKIMTGLRLAEGLEAASISAEAERLDHMMPVRLELAAAKWLESGHLSLADGRWSLTDDGVLIANRVTAAMMAVVR